MHCTSPGSRISGSSDVGGGDDSDPTQTNVLPVHTMTNNNNNNDVTTINNGAFTMAKHQLNTDAVQTDTESGVASDVAQKIYDDPCELMSAEWPSPMHLPRSRSWLCCPNSVAIEGETPTLHRQVSCEYSLVTEEPRLRNGGTHAGVSEGVDKLLNSVFCAMYLVRGLHVFLVHILFFVFVVTPFYSF